MANQITREFTARKCPMSNDYTPQLAPKDAIVDDKIFETIVNMDRLTVSASEYEHLVRRFFVVLTELVASDETDRTVTGVCKARADAYGHLESPKSPWNSTCGVNVNLQLLSETTKKGSSDISHVNADPSVKITLSNVTYEGETEGKNNIKALTPVNANGNNMLYDEKLGDEASVGWTDTDGTAQTTALEKTATDVVRTTFAFPMPIIALEAGKSLVFTMKSRNGVKDGPVTTNTKNVTYLGYDGDPLVWNISTEGLAKNTVKVDADKLVTINGGKLSGCEQVALTFTTKDGTTDAIAIPAADLVSNTADKITLHFTQAMVDATALKGHDLAGATGKLMVTGEEGIVSEYAFAYAAA